MQIPTASSQPSGLLGVKPENCKFQQLTCSTTVLGITYTHAHACLHTYTHTHAHTHTHTQYTHTHRPITSIVLYWFVRWTSSVASSRPWTGSFHQLDSVCECTNSSYRGTNDLHIHATKRGVRLFKCVGTCLKFQACTP